jgi:hypothetical protein
MLAARRWIAGLCGVVVVAFSAAAAAPEVVVTARNGLPMSSDGEHLVFAVDLAARNGSSAPLPIRSIDYTVSIEGTRFFSGTTQAFTVDSSSEKTVPVAGFEGGEGGKKILAALRGTQEFKFVVTGTLHLKPEGGVAVDVPFSSAGTSSTPEEIASAPARKPASSKYSLLSY